MVRKAKAKVDSSLPQEGEVDPVSVHGEKESPVNQSENLFNKPEGELVVDVFETNKEFVVLTAIAGVQVEDLDIAVQEDMMIIKGQRANPNEGSGKYFYQECYWGSFQKKIVLPTNINTKLADAQINKGILTIKIPKMKEENVQMA